MMKKLVVMLAVTGGALGSVAAMAAMSIDREREREAAEVNEALVQAQIDARLHDVLVKMRLARLGR